jgi:hypothetical protein
LSKPALSKNSGDKKKKKKNLTLAAAAKRIEKAIA